MAGSTRTSTAGDGGDTGVSGDVTGDVSVGPGNPTAVEGAQASPPEPEAKTPDSKVTVKFTGSEVIRRGLTKQDWKRVGVEDMEDVWWTAENRHTVDASAWPEAALEIVKNDPDFRVSGA